MKAGFGVRLPVARPLAAPDAIPTVASRAEALDCDALRVHDFIAWTTFQDRTHVSCGSLETVEAAQAEPRFFESLTNLAFLVGITDRIRLGIAVGAAKVTHNVDFEVLGISRRGWLPPWVVPDEERGRGDTQFDIGTEVYVWVARTSEEARRNSDRTLGVLPQGFADEATTESVAQAGLVGSPKRFVRSCIGMWMLA